MQNALQFMMIGNILCLGGKAGWGGREQVEQVEIAPFSLQQEFDTTGVYKQKVKSNWMKVVAEMLVMVVVLVLVGARLMVC